MPGGDRPLLTPSARRLAAWLIAVCAVVTAVLGARVAHQAHATWPDTVIDPWIQATLGYNHVTKDMRNLGSPGWVTGYCVALTVGCLLARRYRAVLLTALSVPLASCITEFVLKPLVGRAMLNFLAYPSGHVTGAAALAAALVVVLAGPSAPPLPAWARWAVAVLAAAAVLLVAAAMVALLDHYATDTIGGAAVGTGTVLAVALSIDAGAIALARRRAAGRPRNQPGAAPVECTMTTGHTITITPAAAHVEVTLAGTKLAETDRAMMLAETGLPARYYLPREDVRTELLTRTATKTTCPFKGDAAYWSANAGGAVHEDVVWSYESPIPQAADIAGLMCFYPDKVELTVDGAAQHG